MSGRKTKKQGQGKEHRTHAKPTKYAKPIVYDTSTRANWNRIIESSVPPIIFKNKPTVKEILTIQDAKDIWLPFYYDLLETPIYHIRCHARMCIEPSCFPPAVLKRETTFHLPPSTFLLNLTAGGEVCWMPSTITDALHQQKDSIRNLLAVRDRSDILYADPGTVSVVAAETETENRLLSLLNRATDCVYPNFYCNLRLDDKLKSGIYMVAKSVSMTVHATSVARPYSLHDNKIIDETTVSPSADGIWTLQEIINTVYTKTGIPKGIFIFTGCTSEQPLDKITKATLSEFNRQRQLIRIEDLRYSTRVPTLQSSTVRAIFPRLRDFVVRDLGYARFKIAKPQVSQLLSLIEPTGSINSKQSKIPMLAEPSALTMAEMAHLLDESVDDLFPEPAMANNSVQVQYMFDSMRKTRKKAKHLHKKFNVT